MEDTKIKAGRPSKKVPAVEIDTIEKHEKLKLKETDIIQVKSNVQGALIYIDHKTTDETIWGECGDIQALTVKELLSMKAKQPSFFKENWITIVGSDDIDMETYSVMDIYNALNIYKYYEHSFVPEDLNDIFFWTNSELEEKIKLMPETIKQSIIVLVNTKLKNGELDSLKIIKTLENILNCKFFSIDD